MDFLDRYTPNFIWKNENALLDYGLIIEAELPYIVANRKYNEIPIIGSNRILHEWHDDYEPYDLTIPNISIPYDNLMDVIKWLRGPGKLITHNDPDKYIRAVCNMAKPQEIKNEWGVFYTFEITFRCDPLKRKVREPFVELNKGTTTYFDPGDEPSKPFFEINSGGGDISITCGDNKLTLLDTFEGTLTIDNELGMYVQNNAQQRCKGNWIKLNPGENKIILNGNVKSATMQNRSVFL